MSVPYRKKSVSKTVLVVSSDVAVLVLLRGILENDYRVLLAADAESAVRLLTANGMRIDLAIVDRNVCGSGDNRLQARMTEILPKLQILSIAGFVQDEIIRFKVLGSSDNFVQQVRDAFTTNKAGRTVPGDICVQAGAGNSA